MHDVSFVTNDPSLVDDFEYDDAPMATSLMAKLNCHFLRPFIHTTQRREMDSSYQKVFNIPKRHGDANDATTGIILLSCDLSKISANTFPERESCSTSLPSLMI